MRSIEPRDPARSFAEVLDALPIIAFMARPDGTVAYVSDAWTQRTGVPRERVLGLGFVDLIYPEDLTRVMTLWEDARRDGKANRAEYRLRFGDGFYHWLLSEAAPLHDDDGRIASWFGTLTLIDDRKRIEQGLRLLSATGAAAVRSLDYQRTLTNFAEALCEDFASYCIIDVDDEGWERIACHRDRSFIDRLRSLTQPDVSHPIQRAIARGESAAIRIDDRWIEEVGADADRAGLVRDLGVRSVIVVPVLSPDGAVIGALTAGLDRAESSGRLYGSEDVPFVEEVGRRAGAAIVNARLFERQRRIAVELQATSLPTALPDVAGLALDAFYRPGSDEATIGGDWYDAFGIEDGRVVLTVGDVRGHGLHAAVAMTKLRQAMQSAAMVEPNPSVMLAVADRTMRLVDRDTYATALAAILDPATGELIVASAGHPPPLVVQGTQLRDVSARGLMLGLGDAHAYNVERTTLAAGSTLVFYTDGLVEATRNFEVGLRRLEDALCNPAVLAAPRPARAIVDAVLGDLAATDDIAVLAVRVTDVSAAARPVVAPVMRWNFDSSDAEAARAVRRTFVEFAQALAPNRIDPDGAELVLGELIGNVVRHAPGQACVCARRAADGIVLTVSSDGPCFTLSHRHTDELAEHGRGLLLVRALAGEIAVQNSALGSCEVEVRIPFRTP